MKAIICRIPANYGHWHDPVFAFLNIRTNYWMRSSPSQQGFSEVLARMFEVCSAVKAAGLASRGLIVSRLLALPNDLTDLIGVSRVG